MTDPAEGKSLVLFDGVCHLCQASVQFIIRHDHQERFVFASLQSETGRDRLARFQLPADQLDTFVLIENGKCHTRSTAALRVLLGLGAWFRPAYALIVLPKPLRDGIYRWVASNRYRWFGKKDHCMVPTPQLKKRFVE